MTMRGTVAACMVVVCVVALLAEQAEGHFTFFSPKEMRVMKEREGKKDVEPRSEDGMFEETSVSPIPEEDRSASPGQTVEIGVKLTAKQLEHVGPVLGDMLQKVLNEAEKGEEETQGQDFVFA
ncbi:motilin-like [Chanos chanos]|uniref:Motilin-like n=1 Tax=Chanos chanos TaxID=29144 RepID=A0A6J2UVY2_CHACN|nr:ghrelin-like [Chanos chanos]